MNGENVFIWKVVFLCFRRVALVYCLLLVACIPSIWRQALPIADAREAASRILQAKTETYVIFILAKLPVICELVLQCFTCVFIHFFVELHIVKHNWAERRCRFFESKSVFICF